MNKCIRHPKENLLRIHRVKREVTRKSTRRVAGHNFNLALLLVNNKRGCGVEFRPTLTRNSPGRNVHLRAFIMIKLRSVLIVDTLHVRGSNDKSIYHIKCQMHCE